MNSFYCGLCQGLLHSWKNCAIGMRQILTNEHRGKISRDKNNIVKLKIDGHKDYVSLHI